MKRSSGDWEIAGAPQVQAPMVRGKAARELGIRPYGAIQGCDYFVTFAAVHGPTYWDHFCSLERLASLFVP